MEGNPNREIEDAVQRALVSAGVQGIVSLSGRTLSLRADGAPVDIDALYLIEQWPLLPEELRERKAGDLAMRLVEALRSAREGKAPAGAAPTLRAASHRPPPNLPRMRSAPTRRPMVLPLGTIAVVLGAALVVWIWFKDTGAPPAGSGGTTTAPATLETRDDRDKRVCDAARQELLQRGTLPQIDAEVWVTELWLATSKPDADLARAPGLAALIDGGKLTAAADAELAALKEASVEIAPEEPTPGASWRSLHVRFTGAYTSAFFSTEGRQKMNALAAKLADATSAEAGALYARCPHRTDRDIGAWYRGATPSLAAAAVVYSTGFFSEHRLTNRAAGSPPTAAELASLVASVEKLDRARIESAVRDAGGMFAPGAAATDPTTITFPLGGPTRAERAVKELATSAHIGPGDPRPAAPGSP
ncbi:MAG: hypothetical protein R3F14_12335 [Polyangiaceae bacterium]